MSVTQKSSPASIAVMLLSATDRFVDLASGLAEHGGVQLFFAKSIAEAKKVLDQLAITAVLADEQLPDGDGLDCIRQISKTHPFVNTALVSALDPEIFHEQTEGLGIFFQIPPSPSRQTGQEILAKLQAIQALFPA